MRKAAGDETGLCGRAYVRVQSISRGQAGRGGYIVTALADWCKLFLGQPQRPDLEALVASGLFEECVSAVVAFAAAGAEDTNHVSLFMTLATLRNCRRQPGCEAKIRSLAPALAFCLENDLDYMEQLGITSASYAAQICESPRSRATLLPLY